MPCDKPKEKNKKRSGGKKKRDIKRGGQGKKGDTEFLQRYSEGGEGKLVASSSQKMALHYHRIRPFAEKA